VYALIVMKRGLFEKKTGVMDSLLAADVDDE